MTMAARISYIHTVPLPQIEVRHLALVTEIADTGSVTRAAERLHLTQSALSHQLRDIESRLATPLFLRLGRRMVLTPAGERVLSSARRVLDDLARTEARPADDGHAEHRRAAVVHAVQHRLSLAAAAARGPSTRPIRPWTCRSW